MRSGRGVVRVTSAVMTGLLLAAAMAGAAFAKGNRLAVRAPRTVTAGHKFDYLVRGRTDRAHRQLAFAIDNLRCAATYAAERSRPGGQAGFAYHTFRARSPFTLSVAVPGTAVLPHAGSQWICVYLIDGRTGATRTDGIRRYTVKG